jgi:hypothetical protein
MNDRWKCNCGMFNTKGDYCKKCNRPSPNIKLTGTSTSLFIHDYTSVYSSSDSDSSNSSDSCSHDSSCGSDCGCDSGCCD